MVTKALVGTAVVVPVAAVVAVWLWRVRSTPRRTWARQELRHAKIGGLLVIPGAIALGGLAGAGTGVGALLLWGVLAAVFVYAIRLDVDEEGFDSDTRWLIDISCLAFVAVTVFFSFVGYGCVFLPAAAFLAVSWRLAQMRRRRKVVGHTG